ncbi:MAG: hypothetical protein ACOCUI_00885 [bacterium]
MKIKEIINGLQDLIDDRESFLDKDGKGDKVFRYDIDVLKAAINYIEESEDIASKQIEETDYNYII